MTDTVFVSFYTENWLYSQMASRLSASLYRLNIPYDIRPLNSSGSWLTNTRLKANYIRQMLDLYPKIVWIDVDSELHQYPHMLMEFTEDLLLRPHSTVPDRCWHVSVMGWKSGALTRALCDNWIMTGDLHAGTDEAAFDIAIRSHSGPLSVGNMPAKYHRLPHEARDNAVITIGLSQDEDKLRIKYGEGFK